MKKYNLIISSLFFLVVFTFPLLVKADAFSIHLFYDTKTNTLRFNKSAVEPVSENKNQYVSAMEFALNDQPGDYILKIFDASNNELASVEFNKKDGEFNLDIPYFSLAHSLKIIDKSSNKEILSTDLTKFSTCNGNGVCEYEKGETALNCLGDCAGGNPNYSDETKKTLEKNNGIIRDPATGDVLLKEKSSSVSGQGENAANNQDNSSGKEAPVSLMPSTINNQTNQQQSNASNATVTQNQSNPWILIAALLVLLGVVGFIVYKKFIKK